jgi:hypothetical protein
MKKRHSDIRLMTAEFPIVIKYVSKIDNHTIPFKFLIYITIR